MYISTEAYRPDPLTIFDGSGYPRLPFLREMQDLGASALDTVLSDITDNAEDPLLALAGVAKCQREGCMYRIDHCVAGCMTRYLPREKLSPAESEEVRGRSPRYFRGFQGR